MNNKFLDIAFLEAEKALTKNEVPVGAVIVKDGKVLAKAYNRKEFSADVTCHAEILAIKKASQKINNWRLDDCDIYVTLDPCPMCASAIKQCRIKNVYSALSNLDVNNDKIISNIFNTNDINPSVNFVSNLAVEKAKSLLQKFFKNKR